MWGNSSRNRVRPVAVAVLVLLAIGAAACSSSDDEPAASDAPAQVQTDDTTATTDGTTDATVGEVSDRGPVDRGDPETIGEGDPMNLDPVAPGATRIRYSYGPIDVKPGQNNIEFTAPVEHPDEDGWIVRISPNLIREDGTVPPVDVVHLHHGVWLNTSRQDISVPRLPERMFAAGEEKTIATAPEGYGYRNDPDDTWIINYMLHNAFPTEEQLWLVYDLDFIPADAPEAADIAEARPIWLDVVNGSVYPVFDVLGNEGDGGTFTFPDDDPDAYGDGAPLNDWVVDQPGVLMGGAGHVHPGGLTVDLYLDRPGASAAPGSAAADDVQGSEAHLFTSEARYFDPNGPVSWDLSMTYTPGDWRVATQPGDTLRIRTTYDTEFGSWYEAMGIFVLWFAPGETDGADPFVDKVNVEGAITHGPLPENTNYGGEDIGLPDPRDLPSGEAVDTIPIEDFFYLSGDISEGNTEVPVVEPGQTITFDNSPDAPLENGIWHTITSCKAPCTGATGVSYPLADSEVVFDSGQLGDAGEPTAGRLTWETPADLDPGTYTYFCRVHPFMRGAFRVESE